LTTARRWDSIQPMKIHEGQACSLGNAEDMKKVATEKLVVRSGIRAGSTLRPVRLNNKVWTDDWLAPV
jgi:hypothetical protein